MKDSNSRSLLALAILLAALIVAGGLVVRAPKSAPARALATAPAAPSTAVVSLISPGTILPEAYERDLAAQLVAAGAIDPAKLPSATELNLLWAFGLANKNDVLERGPMMDPRYGGPTQLASVGGWTAAKGIAMDHYSMHALLMLSPEQQALVERVSKHVFRPCCKNSAYFPDCNHGMAMLGLLEILASQGKTEADLYAAADKANGIWFPQTGGQGSCGLSAAAPQQPAAQPSCGLQP